MHDGVKSEAYNADCLEAMRAMPDKAFDLAIVDPPYGICAASMNMGSRKTVRPDRKSWDNETPPLEYFTELRRVSRNQIIWGGNYFLLPPTRCFAIWDKGETLYGRSFAECEFAWTSFDASARVVKINPMQLERIHTCQKPIELYTWLLNKFAKPGNTILDTHLGSGSSRIACHDLGFDFTGYELDKDYFEAQEKRFANHIAQPQLFRPEPAKQSELQKPLFTAADPALESEINELD